MKSVVISLAIAAAIAVSSVIYSIHLHKMSREFCEINNEITSSLNNDNFDKAIQFTEKLTECFEKRRNILAATDNHDVTDKIEMNLRELYEYIEGKSKTDALSKCRVLGFLFEHLPAEHELKTENIL